jgi:hypothetical protein
MKFTGVATALLAFAVAAQAQQMRAVVTIPSISALITDGMVTVSVLFSEAAGVNFQGITATSTTGFGTAAVTTAAVCNACSAATGIIAPTQFTTDATSGGRKFTVDLVGLNARGKYSFQVILAGTLVVPSNIATLESRPTSTFMATLVPGRLDANDNRFLNTPVNNIYQYNTGPELVQMGVIISDAKYNVPANPSMLVTAETTLGGQISPAVTFDYVYRQGEIFFTVEGRNNAILSVALSQGFAVDYTGSPSPASAAPVMFNLQFAQACARGPATVGPYTACVCAAGSMAGTQTRTKTPGVQFPATNGGAVCVADTSVEDPISCSCAMGTNMCAGRCYEVNPTNACGCGPNCALSPGGCCRDVFNTCAANLPSCRSAQGVIPGNLACGEASRNPFEPGVNEAGMVCSCAHREAVLIGNQVGVSAIPCRNFEESCGGDNAFCEIITGQNWLGPDATAPAWCSTDVNPRGGSLVGASCSCASTCMAAGNCCVDYSRICKTQHTLCNSNTNCNSVVGDSFNDPVNSCFCGVNGAVVGVFYGVSTVCTDSDATCGANSNLLSCKPAGTTGTENCGTAMNQGAFQNRACDCRNVCLLAANGGGQFCCADLRDGGAGFCPP